MKLLETAVFVFLVVVGAIYLFGSRGIDGKSVSEELGHAAGEIYRGLERGFTEGLKK